MPAMQDLTAIFAVLSQNVRPNVVRTYNRRSTLMKTLRIEQGEGKNICWDWESDGAIAETFSDGEDVVNFGTDDLNQATLPWGLYRSNFKVGDLARAAARSSRTPTGLLRLWARAIMNAISKNASVINKGLFAGRGANSIIGLDDALDDANIYAGVDRSLPQNAGFRATLIDPGQPTKPSIAAVRDDLRLSFERSGIQPDLAITTPSIYNALGGRFDESRRRVQDITTARGTIRLDGSVGGIEVDGCVFLRDKDATPGSIYYLQTDVVRIEYLPQDMEVEVPGTTQQQTDDGYGTVPLGMVVEPLAKTGDAMKSHVKVFLQMAVEAPHMCARRLNVASA
jgi:hypothetical protein